MTSLAERLEPKIQAFLFKVMQWLPLNARPISACS